MLLALATAVALSHNMFDGTLIVRILLTKIRPWAY